MSDAPITPARRGTRLRRPLIAFSAGVATIVTLLASLGLGAYVWADRQRTTLSIDAFGPTPGEDAGAAPDVLGRCAQRACNYLLLGSDSREGLTEEEIAAFGDDEHLGGTNRADTIILVHTRPGSKEAIFLSFPRDLWVDIPGAGPGRINSAFEGGVERGGALLVAKTVKAITGMQIHHVMYVSLLGFQRVVDALGGIEMCVPYAMQDPLSLLDIPAGCQHFDGFTALAYVRTRHQPCDTVPDFARIGRQQQFLRAVIAKILRPEELLRLPNLVPRVLDNLVVDEGLNPAELVYLAGLLEGVGTENVDFRAVPTIPEGIVVEGSYLSVVTMIEEDANELFRRIREGEPLGDLGAELAQTPPSPANVVAAVYSKDPGGSAATNVLELFTEGGFNTSPGVVQLSDIEAPRRGSFILFREGAEPAAKVVGTYLHDLDLVPAPEGVLPEGQDVGIVVAPAYEIPEPKETVECP
ncbi:MAG TPA: LCP family protein [Actinomycetota bacterium]|nr:LCP family protein [Actinomycetota bacterium]